jgi:hypothetical protein
MAEIAETMNSTRPHVIPIGDKHLHSASEKCWCHPLNNDGVVVHNAKDCREVSERQNIETDKIWVEVLESYQRETKPLAAEVRPGQEYTLALKLEAALRNHMTNYGGAEYAESAIAAIRAEVGL